MSTATITATDVRLRNAAVRQLDWDPAVDASAIGVAAKDGVVTLTGFIDSYAGKLAAERVLKRVRGVRAVANDITVRLLVERTDADIARDTLQALKVVPVLADTVVVTVHNGRVTLTGTVEWLFQKEHAEAIVEHVRGVVGVFNHVTVRPRSGQRDIQRRIVGALHHHADIDARGVPVALDEDVVTLTGTVETWTQREAAEHAASSAPGITRVDNRLVVDVAEPHEVEPPDEIC
jgi:osmotically-inducible protein OsmY